MGRIDKLRIDHQRALLVPLGPPLRQRLAGEVDRLARRLPEEVIAADEAELIPRPGQELAGVPVDKVVLQRERQVVLDSRGLDLLLLAEGQDIVPEDVLLAIVLMEAAGLGVVDKIIFERSRRCSLRRCTCPSRRRRTNRCRGTRCWRRRSPRTARACRCRPCRS